MGGDFMVYVHVNTFLCFSRQLSQNQITGRRFTSKAQTLKCTLKHWHFHLREWPSNKSLSKGVAVKPFLLNYTNTDDDKSERLLTVEGEGLIKYF